MIREEDLFPIGKFQKTHALKGELNAVFDIDEDFLDEDYPLIIDLDGIFVPFYTESWRPKGSSACLLKLEGVDNEGEARKFVNKTIFGRKEDVRDFVGEEDIHSLDGLAGYDVEITGHGILGKVSGIDDNTANVLLIVERPDGSEVYLPLAEDFIDAIDDDNRTLRMTVPEGLLSINDKETVNDSDDDE